MNSLQKYLKKMRSDRGDSELASLLILLPIVLGILFTTIDSAIYFTNRASMQSATRDAARSVAIMGGRGTESTSTPIEAMYGVDYSQACSGVSSNLRVKKAFRNDLSAIECNLLKTIGESSSFVNIEVEDVQCNPEQTSYITERTSCRIDWIYKSIPASGLTLIKKSPSGSTPNMQDKNGLVETNVTIGTSEAEVDLTGIDQLPRS